MTLRAIFCRPGSTWSGILACCMFAGCASTPDTHFYTLGGQPPVNQAPGTRQTGPAGAGVTITALTIPELVDRPQLVLRSGGNRVSVLDNQRWAESLKTGVAKVFATDLAAQLGTSAVGLPTDRSTRKGDVSVSIDITRFDSTLNGTVQIDARWSVRGAGDAPASSGSASAQEPSGATIDEVVAAYDRALARIADALVRTVRQVVAGGR